MVPQYSPWAASSTFGSPKSASPAFQREWESLSSSGILIDESAGNDQIIVKPVSAAGGTSGTIYLWGVTFVCDQSNAGAIRIHNDDDSETYCVAVATRQGPYFLALPTPLKITENSGLKARVLATQTSMHCTPMYTTSQLKYQG
tara:strand:+ start:125 stop:556 length:432 start_codon:yes stop_codon:yes gene_type:complete